jgi:hypothetical protein
MPRSSVANEHAMINETMTPSPASTPEVTRILARYIGEARYEQLPENVRNERVRTLLNSVRQSWLCPSISRSPAEIF